MCNVLPNSVLQCNSTVSVLSSATWTWIWKTGHNWRSVAKQLATTFVTWVDNVKSRSIETPRSRMTNEGSTELSPKWTDDVGSCCSWCRELHHRNSILATFSCWWLVLMHLATSSTQVVICRHRSSVLCGWQKPYTHATALFVLWILLWEMTPVSSAYKWGCKM